MMTCFDPSCNEPAEEQLEEVQGIKIRVCTRGHRTGKILEVAQPETGIIKAAQHE